MHNLSKNLKYHRVVRGYTQRELAERINIKTRSYQRYESGEREPNIDTIIALADFFDISLDDLIRGNDYIRLS